MNAKFRDLFFDFSILIYIESRFSMFMQKILLHFTGEMETSDPIRCSSIILMTLSAC